ncbi:hypothetical protein CRUP_018704 [Coryphaenoides rupestris]|nr:hypothetical protein CRUP_018704 [Coryphaenoides rupestris]
MMMHTDEGKTKRSLDSSFILQQQQQQQQTQQQQRHTLPPRPPPPTAGEGAAPRDVEGPAAAEPPLSSRSRSACRRGDSTRRRRGAPAGPLGAAVGMAEPQGYSSW